MAYVQERFGSTKKPPPNPLTQQYKLADTAVTQQAGDYDTIMRGYTDNLAALRNQTNNGVYSPTIPQYQPTTDYTSALGQLKNLGQTGGYSPGDVADLRERGISPIRSVYANAQRDINRRNTVSGGVSANYNALKARMAREESSKIADQVTNVNASIADRIASNKVGLAGTTGQLAAGEQSERNRFGLNAAEIQNEASRFNATRKDANNSNILQNLSGMQSLYGTTPALSSLFGNQALQAASLQNNINQQNISNGLSLIGKRVGGR